MSSCGIQAEVGGVISENAKIALNEIGVTCDKFAPKQLTQHMVEDSVLVVTMTSNQKQLLERCGNVVSMKDVYGSEIPDPYGRDLNTYRITRNAIYNACESLIDKFILNYKENT